MNALHLSYNDPLFSLILLVATVFILALFNYWWLRYRKNQESSSIEHFFSHFHKEGITPIDEREYDNVPSAIVKQLAHCFFDRADYQSNIELYLALLKRTLPIEEKRDIMQHLGYTYFKAGFLERSQSIFLQIIKQFPRDIHALQALLLVYESKKKFEKALEILDALEILQVDVAHDRDYIVLLSSKQTARNEPQTLIHLYETSPQLVHPIFSLLFTIDATTAWQTLKPTHYRNVLDILWYLDADKLNLDIIATEPFLRQIYSARGDIHSAQESSQFELDILIALTQNKSKKSATLSFEYICTHCRRSAAFAFGRCIHCHHVSSMMVQPKLMKESFEVSNAFL